MRYKNLFITTHGLNIGKKGNAIKIEGRKDISLEIPIGSFTNMFILSNVKISTRVIKYLSFKGKYIFVIRSNGRLQSIILPEIVNSQFELRKLQYEQFEKKDIRLKLIRELLVRKLIKFKEAIYKFAKASGKTIHKDHIKDIITETENMIYRYYDEEQLRGVDGYIMKKLYFEFEKSIKEFSFGGRSYHPPTDEANAVLSMIFSIFYSLLIPLIVSYGMDPYCGFFHVRRGKHAVLSSDILEIIRPDLVFLAADILNSGYLTHSDFKKIGKAVYIRPKSLKVISKLICERIEFNEIIYPAEKFLSDIKKFIQGKKCDMLSYL